MMKALWSASFLGGNAEYLEQEYESWLEAPESVSSDLSEYFEQLKQLEKSNAKETPHSTVRKEFKQLTLSPRMQATGGPHKNLEHERKQVGVNELINAYRLRGHQWAKINPLKERSHPQNHVRELELSEHGLSEQDFATVFNTGNMEAPEQMQLKEIHAQLEKTYCGPIGIEYMHVLDTTQKEWLQQRFESAQGKPNFDFDRRRWLLQRLTNAEGIEKYLHTKYVGQKRFSLEGGESLIPLLAALVQKSSQKNMKELVIGMAHRGRLNVLVNILGKAPSELFAEFEGTAKKSLSSGDVKYHQGFSSDIQTEDGEMHLTLAFNPSHLEIVSPVVQGSVRSRQDRRQKFGNEVMAISIHGDAAFAGQGVVMETFNMAEVRGYTARGTIHIVINNQIGFTTSHLEDSRSTVYATDVAKMINAPILHVNGDDPEAVLFAAQLAFDYRMQFKKDVIVDLYCYRRHGHNEADEPSATQPVMYKAIKALPTTRKLYADYLTKRGVIADGEGQKMASEFRDHLDAGDCVALDVIPGAIKKDDYTIDWTPHLDCKWRDPWKNKTPLKKLKGLATQLTTIPDNIKLHPRVKKIYDDRRKITAEDQLVDWGYAENLAYATILDNGYSVRLSGQDCGRGTFFHRHAVLHNQETGDSYTPLEHITEEAQPKFKIIDSVLSEEAVLAFEYGYSTNDPKSLVIWEAQFGDFANGAQVVIDQFITSGEAKWGRLCGIVMLLPHGYEGQGPEHSSARLERFLQLCATDNMQVVVPSTPAQCYHMLRRQMLRNLRQPLVVMSPKSLLRHKMAVSTLKELSEGTFQPVIGDIDNKEHKKIDRLVFCSGKVYYDLLAKSRDERLDNVALVRLEQLYPFPYDEMHAITEKYKGCDRVIWCQEEPRNQGAWFASRHRIERCLKPNQTINYAGREPSASPAVGYASIHAKEQAVLVAQTLGIAT